MPLIPSPINRVPKGLLDLLGIRVAGRNPQSLNEQLLANFELTDWYLESYATKHIFANTAFAASTGASNQAITSTNPALPNPGGVIQVPQNEVWILRRGSSLEQSFSAHAGSEAVNSFIAADGITTQVRQVPQTFVGYTTSVAAFVRVGASIVTEDFWMTPNETLRVKNYGVTVGAGGTVTVTGSLNLVRLRV